MQIINLEDKNKLNEFIIRVGGSFLQSWEWGDFQEKMGAKIWRLGVEDPSASSGQVKLVAVATIIKKKLPFKKSYFYSPRGPMIKISDLRFQIADFLFREIQKIAKSEKVIFLRFEPNFQITNYQLPITQTLDVQPSKTLILGLSKSEEELLKAMREKTRYNIRLSEKKGVKIIEADTERFDDFWKLMKETGGRDDFRLHSRDYYREMLGMGNNFKNPPAPLYQGGINPPTPPLYKGGVRLFFAEYDPSAGSGQRGKPIAAGIFSFFGDTATYLHGGSANEFRNVMAPYLLQWEVIKKAKRENYKNYDFFGIDEKKWPGVTRFKKGFGGAEVNCPGTFDAVFNKGWYNVYKMMRKVRRNF